VAEDGLESTVADQAVFTGPGLQKGRQRWT